MDIILLHEGMYQVITVTKAMFEGAVRPEIVDCFSLCDILREKFTGANKTFFGCVCN